MIHLFQSPWFALTVGLLLYGLTTLGILRPDQLAADLHPRPPDPDVPVRPLEPSWDFKNPEIEQLLAELRQEREAVQNRSRQLQELEARLAVERQEIQTVTQAVFRLQRQLDAEFASIREEEAVNLKRLARIYAAMSPEGASRILLEFEDDQAVKVFALMKEAESAPILELMAADGQPAARRVALISDQLRRLRAKPPTPPARAP